MYYVYLTQILYAQLPLPVVAMAMYEETALVFTCDTIGHPTPYTLNPKP